MANTAWRDGHRVLCQWQKFDETWLSHTLSTTQNYCSSPNSFNASWDCKPHFNSDVLADTAENERHVRWAVELGSRKTRMSTADLEHMKLTLLTDRTLMATQIPPPVATSNSLTLIAA